MFPKFNNSTVRSPLACRTCVKTLSRAYIRGALRRWNGLNCLYSSTREAKPVMRLWSSSNRARSIKPARTKRDTNGDFLDSSQILYYHCGRYTPHTLKYIPMEYIHTHTLEKHPLKVLLLILCVHQCIIHKRLGNTHLRRCLH